MIDNDLLNAARLRLRKNISDELDADIAQLAEAAIYDLKRIGVAERFLSPIGDPLIREAVLVYVAANYGDNPDREKLSAAYEMILCKIKGGRYGD